MAALGSTGSAKLAGGTCKMLLCDIGKCELEADSCGRGFVVNDAVVQEVELAGENCVMLRMQMVKSSWCDGSYPPRGLLNDPVGANLRSCWADNGELLSIYDQEVGEKLNAKVDVRVEGDTAYFSEELPMVQAAVLQGPPSPLTSGGPRGAAHLQAGFGPAPVTHGLDHGGGGRPRPA